MTRALLFVLGLLLVAILFGVDVRGIIFAMLAAGGAAVVNGGQQQVVAAAAPPDARWSLIVWCFAILLAALPLIVVLAGLGIVLHRLIVPGINNLRYARDQDYQRAKVVDALVKRPRGLTQAEAAMMSGVHESQRQVIDARRDEAQARADKARLAVDYNRNKLEQMRLAGQPMRQLESPVQPLPIEQKPQEMTLQEAIASSSLRSWVLGQAYEIQPVEGFKQWGRLVTFDSRTNHGAIIGGTGSGKTASTGILMAYYARKFGLHPIVLDGKEGIDWGPYDGIVEWHSMDVWTISGQIQALHEIYIERKNLLKATGAPNIYALPAAQRPVPIFLLVEEFGDVWLGLKRMQPEKWKELSLQVDSLFRLARATGITLCLIDQAPEKWSQQMRGNAKFCVCYKLKGGVANAFNEYHVDKLPGVGVFSQDNVFYKAWHTQAELDLASQFSPLTRRLLTVKQPKHNDAAPARTQPAPSVPALRPVVASEPAAPAAAPPPTPQPDTEPVEAWPQALVDAGVVYVTERKWDAFAQAWCAANRANVTPAHLARAMAAFHNEHFPTDNKDWKINFYSQARRLFARYHAAGEPERVEGVPEQIIRDEAKQQQVATAKRAGATIVTLRHDELVKPKFMQ